MAALAGLDAVEQAAPSAPVPVPGQKEDAITHRPRHARAQRRANRCQADAPIRFLRHDAEGREHPQESRERRRMRARAGRQVFDALRTRREQIGEAQLRRDVKHLHGRIVGDELQH